MVNPVLLLDEGRAIVGGEGEGQRRVDAGWRAMIYSLLEFMGSRKLGLLGQVKGEI